MNESEASCTHVLGVDNVVNEFFDKFKHGVGQVDLRMLRRLDRLEMWSQLLDDELELDSETRQKKIQEQD